MTTLVAVVLAVVLTVGPALIVRDGWRRRRDPLHQATQTRAALGRACGWDVA